MYNFHKEQRYSAYLFQVKFWKLLFFESYFFFLWHFMENTCSSQQVMGRFSETEKILNMN